MSGFPSLPLFVREYLVDTTSLTLEQSGAYLHLLMHAWVRGGSLPDDECDLAACAKVSVKKWRAIWPSISRFWTAADGTLTNKRLSQELQYVTEVSEKRRSAGARGGRAKADRNQGDSASQATVLLKPGSSTKTKTNTEQDKSCSDAIADRRRGSRLPATWALPKPWGEWAVSEGMAESRVRIEADKFRDYWTAKSGSGAAKLDWLATWRNWVRTAVASTPKRGPDSEDAKLEAWGIYDAKPSRLEQRIEHQPAPEAAGAPDMPGVLPWEEGPEPTRSMLVRHDNAGWAGSVLSPLRTLGGCVS